MTFEDIKATATNEYNSMKSEIEDLKFKYNKKITKMIVEYLDSIPVGTKFYIDHGHGYVEVLVYQGHDDKYMHFIWTEFNKRVKYSFIKLLQMEG